MVSDLDAKSVASVAKSAAPSQKKGEGGEENADADDKDEDSKAAESSKEVLEAEIDFLSLQIHHLLCQYPQPKLTKEMEKKVRDSEENLFKFKLMEIKDKMMKMSTLQFDSISQGRVEKQTEDFCLTVAKALFGAVRRARAIIEEQEEKDESSAIDKNALN